MFYSLNGIREAATFRKVNEDIIKKVEDFVKNDLTNVITMWKGKGIEIKNSDFYGELFENNPEQFEFTIGDRLQIEAIVEFVKSKYDENDLKFSGAHHFLPDKPKKNQKQKTKQVTPYSYFGENDENRPPNFSEIPADNCKTKLIEKITKMYIKHGHIDAKLENELVSIERDGEGKIRALITCVLCATNKSNRFVIRSKGNVLSCSGDPYWVLSNYEKHVKLHLKKMTNVTTEFETQNLSLDDQQLENDESDYDKRTSMSDSNEMHVSNETINDVDDEWVDLPSGDEYAAGIEDSIEIMEFTPEETVPLTYADLESLIYKQISTQLIQIQQICLKNNEKQLKMDFQLENLTYTLHMAEIAGDGSCLFRAVDHQINKSKLNKRAQNTATNQLRKRVVAHIKEHEILFESELMGSVYDRNERNGKNVQNMKDACHNFLYYDLPKSSCWAGSESIKAISRLYLVNVLIIRDDGCIYFSNGFDCNFKNTIILAHTSSTDEQNTTKREKPKPKPNHYDSVVYIEPDDILELSKRLADIAYKRSTSTAGEQIEISD